MVNKPALAEIQRIVGPVTEEQIRFIDTYVFEDIGLFLPIGGQCYYSLSPEHVHPSYMVIYSFNGENDGWINGVDIGSLKAGELLFMAPHIKHQEAESSTTPTYIALMIMPEMLEPIAAEYGISLQQLTSTVTTAKAQKQLLPLCWQFIAEANLPNTRTSLLKALTIQLAHSVLQSVFSNSTPIEYTEWRIEIGHSIAFIHSHLHEKINLASIADSANMSVPNFSKVFKREMAKTPIEYLTEQRLYKAVNMLRSGEFTMQDIANSCGFSSVPYFSTSFRKRYLMPPEKYRQKMGSFRV